MQVSIVDVNQIQMILPNGGIDLSCWDRVDGVVQPVDAASMRETWRELVEHDGELRIIESGSPRRCEVDRFDAVVASVFGGQGEGKRELTGLIVSGVCAEETGGLINPDFFMGRISAMGLDR